MSKTALVDALKHFDLDQVRAILKKRPELKELRLDKGVNILQFSCGRFTGDEPTAASRQLRLAKWLVGEGFDPRENYTTAPGDDGEAESASVSLAWYSVAKAQSNRLARYFLQQGAAPGALFAAAWWGNADIIPDLVRHGADLNEVVGATPLTRHARARPPSDLMSHSRSYRCRESALSARARSCAARRSREVRPRAPRSQAQRGWHRRVR